MTNRKMILIDESELKSLIKDAVNDAVDNITKKIAAKCATLSYNNKIFNNEGWANLAEQIKTTDKSKE